LWLERAEIDYIGPSVKAWAAFNAWYREASAARRDTEGLRYVKEHPNPVRGSVKPLLQPAQTDGHGNILPDYEAAQKFKLLIRDLHVGLDSFHIEVTREEIVERISFRAVCLGRGPNLPLNQEYNRLRYRVDRAHNRWRSTVCPIANPADVRADIEQDAFDVDGLQGH
jgi:catechol 2,3-dioxygenase-like lactoylglutathione lyase family enzyme